MLAKAREKYRYSMILLRELVKTDFKVKYQDSFLGYLWSALKPLFMFAIMYFAFVKIMRIGAGIDFWPTALLFGNVIWQFFNDVSKGGLKTVVNHGGLLRKMKFPRYVIVISSSLSACISLGINLVIVAIFGAINHVPLSWWILLVIPVVILVYIFSLGLAFLLSTIYVKFRDIEYIWDVITQGLFYASAIIFPMTYVLNIHAVGTVLAQILLINPLAMALQEFRHFAINADIPSLSSISGGNWWFIIFPILIAIAAFVLGALYFKKKSPSFAEDV